MNKRADAVAPPLRRAALTFGSFIVLTLTWVAALWFVFRPPWAAWDTTSIVALHALPPLAVFAGFFLFRVSYAARVKRQEDAAAESKAALARQHEQETRDAAAQALAQRRLALPILGIGLRSALAETAEAHIGKLRPAQMAHKMKPCLGCNKDGDDIVLYLRERLVHALDELALDVDQPFPLPIWFAIPDWLTQNEAWALLDSVWYAVHASHSTLPARENIRILREAGLRTWISQAFELFDSPQAPPGLLLLAIDSPYYALRHGLKLPHATELRAASEAAVALLIGHPELMAGQDRSIEGQTGQHGPLTPFWEKENSARPGQALSCPLLADHPAIAYLHRPGESAALGYGALEEGLHDGLVNASLRAPTVDNGPPGLAPIAMAALVQQGEAGMLQHFRSLLSRSLTEQAVEGEHLQPGLFITELFGYIGNASYVGQQAVAALLAAERQQPALWAQQGVGDSLLLGAMQPTAARPSATEPSLA